MGMMQKIFISVSIVAVALISVSIVGYYVVPKEQPPVGGEITTPTAYGTPLPTPIELPLLKAVPVGGAVSEISFPSEWQVAFYTIPALLSLAILGYVAYLSFKLAMKPMPKRRKS